MNTIKVVVVDDSAFSRRTITKLLEGIKGIKVVGFATNGEEGIQKVIALKPDLITVDLEMPKMDGFTLLRILTTRFPVPVLVISALSGADKVFKALELGALDFVAKPTSTASTDLLLIRDDLEQKVLHIINHKPKDLRSLSGKPAAAAVKNNKVATPQVHGISGTSAIDLVAIGASTGGPPALQHILSSFDQALPFAIVVSQHMPSGFTKAFADRLNRSSPFEVKEAVDGDLVCPGRALIAPGGMNLVVEQDGGQVIARVVSPSPSDRYLPSVDVMLESCANVYRQRMIAIILTGMGNDGARGVRAVNAKGGYVIAESDESSVVFGMPREAIATGVVDRVVPLQRVGREILIRGDFI